MAKYPVVVYGASGYTGMLIMDWLIDQQIPFTAVARNAKRVQEMMAQRVVRLESATYEIVEAEHTVEALTKAFKGAKVVCNTVGPFVNFGLTAVEAALKAGCHHLDTTGEQSYMRAVREQFGERFRQAGLLVSPSIAYMYTFAEIAAELALETPGVDVLETATLCRGPRLRRLGRHGRLDGVDLRAVPLRAVLPVGEEARRRMPSARRVQRRRPELRAAGVLAAVGRHLAAGVLRARRARAQLHVLCRLLRQQRDAAGARPRPEVGGRVQEPAQGAPGRGDQADRRFDHAEHAAARAHHRRSARSTSPSAAASSRRCAPRCTASRPTSPPARCRPPPS